MKQQYFTLFKAYRGALYAFRASVLRNRTYVCAARDQEGVDLLFRQNAIVFSREKIFSKDFDGLCSNTGRGQTEQILDILDREGGRDQRFLIVEDQIKAPTELKELCSNMEVIYASYGYGLESDWIKAGLANVREVVQPESLVYNIY